MEFNNCSSCKYCPHISKWQLLDPHNDDLFCMCNNDKFMYRPKLKMTRSENKYIYFYNVNDRYEDFSVFKRSCSGYVKAQ